MLKIKHHGFQASVKQLAKALISTGIIPQKKHNRLTTEIRYLKEGPERFGEVDIANRQQLELVAYRIAKGRVARPPKGRQPKRKISTYKLAIIGSGSTAAYYIDTLGPAYDHHATIVIGEENPWIKIRGKGIDYVNHTERQISFPSKNITVYGGNESFVNRAKFGIEATNIIRTHCRTRINSRVKCITKDRANRYRVDYYHNRTIRSITAEKVVFAAGAGGLRTPPEVNDETIQNRAKIIDMNTFIREKAIKGSTPGRVVIWGSNAAIDAVACAVRHNWTVCGWLYSQRGQPSWLPGTRYLNPPYSLDSPEVTQPYVYRDRNLIRIEDDGPTLKVSDNGKLIANDLDYVVYGLGTLDLLEDHSIMHNSVKEGQAKLLPILDNQGVFDDPIDPSRQTHAFLGWQNPSKTFQVFGLAAENYAGVQGRRPSRISPTDKRTMALKSWLSGDVLSVGQLTYIRSALRAINSYIPGSIEHRVDYSHSDTNTIRVHLAARYPDLPEVYASWLINMLRRIRTSFQERLPHGFTETQVDIIEDRISEKQENILEGGPNTRIDAVNWQWNLGNELMDSTPAPGQEVTEALAKIDMDNR